MNNYFNLCDSHYQTPLIPIQSTQQLDLFPCTREEKFTEVVQPLVEHPTTSFDVEDALNVFRQCEGNYSRPEQFDLAVAAKLYNRGCGLETFIAAFQDSARYETKYALVRAKGDLQLSLEYLQILWERVASQDSLKRDDTEVSEYCQALTRWVEQQQWKGQGGKSDKALLMAHARVCGAANKKNEDNKYYWNADIRSLAEIAGTSASTASNATRRLIEAGYLMRCTRLRTQLSHSNFYKFGASLDSVLTNPIKRIAKATYDLVRSPVKTYGVFENRAGLGKTAEAIWVAVCDGCNTLEKLMARTGSAKHTIRKHLAEMGKWSIITEMDGDIQAAPDYAFEKLALVLGSRDRGYRRAVKHDEERARQSNYIELQRMLREQDEQ